MRWVSSHRSAASNDTPASGPSPRAYAENASSTSASTRHGSGSVRDSSAHNDSACSRVLPHRQRVERVAHQRVGQRTRQPRGRVIGQRLPVGDLRGRGDRRFDVASHVGIRPVDVAAADRRRQSRAAGRIGDGNDLLQLRAPRIEPAPVQARPPRPAATRMGPRRCPRGRSRPHSATVPRRRPGRRHARQAIRCRARPAPKTGRRPADGIRRCTSGSLRPLRRPRRRSPRRVLRWRPLRRCARPSRTAHRKDQRA